MKAARTAARTALRQVALAQELAIEEERNKARRDRAGPRTRTNTFSGGPRQRRQGPPRGRRDGDRGASSWGWGHQGNGSKLSSGRIATASDRASPAGNRGTTNASTGGSAHGAGYHNDGGSLAPSFEGSAHYSGSVGSVGGGRIAGTDAFGSAGTSGSEVAGGAAAATAQNLRGLNEDSVVWASTRRGSSRSSSCSRNRGRRKEVSEGQVETIGRLVHMGLL